MVKKMTSSILKLLSIGCVLAVVIALQLATAEAATAKKSTCEEKIALINYRSDLLAVYKKTEDKQYQAFYKKWSNRISYAAQWVPKDAEKARAVLYEYDALHAATNKELDKQIRIYRFLGTQPLSCTNIKPVELSKRLEEVNGLKDKKVVGGNALISQHKQQETEFLKKDYRKASEKMIHKLHKAKSKHPKPEHPKLRIRG